jgi:hypothetical protein
MFLRVESNREVGHLLISIWNRQRSLQVGRVIGDEELCKSNRTAAVNLNASGFKAKRLSVGSVLGCTA